MLASGCAGSWFSSGPPDRKPDAVWHVPVHIQARAEIFWGTDLLTYINVIRPCGGQAVIGEKLTEFLIWYDPYQRDENEACFEKIREKGGLRLEASRSEGASGQPLPHFFFTLYTNRKMPRPRGSEHTSLTETATLVVRELAKLPGIKMIAPGEIRSNARARNGKRFVTASITTAGFELLISGQSVQKVSVHTDSDPQDLFVQLTEQKKLKDITFTMRERKPGV